MDGGREARARDAASWQSAHLHAGAPAEVREEAVHDLIQRAEASDHGRSFLVDGSQDAVAAVFGVHAFVVDAARERLSNDA